MTKSVERTALQAVSIAGMVTRPDNCTYFFLLSPSAYL